MLEINKIYNENCLDTIKRIDDKMIDGIITSPFYNNSKKITTEHSRLNNDCRYDVHIDNLTDNQYIEFTIQLFNGFNRILKDNGCILYNMSYSSTNTELMFKTVSAIFERTNFTLADDIIWKKKTAIPNNVSKNKLTRITEHIFVFCRKNEFKSFNSNKKVIKISKTGQKIYDNIYNYIEAKNNDGSCKLNKATFSTELIDKLIKIYIKPGSKIYDPFIGTGTTAVSCIKNKCYYIGSEISEAQCNYAKERIHNFIKSSK